MSNSNGYLGLLQVHFSCFVFSKYKQSSVNREAEKYLRINFGQDKCYFWGEGGVFPRFLNIDTEGALCKIMITYKVTDVKTLQ